MSITTSTRLVVSLPKDYESIYMIDDVIFNDADGSDRDIDIYNYYMNFLCHEDCNAWDDSIFSVEITNGGYSILYDNQKDNIRYFIGIGYNLVNNLRDITIKIGPTYCGHPYTPDKEVKLNNVSYSLDYFLNCIDGNIDIPSSKEKIIRVANQFCNLKAFL